MPSTACCLIKEFSALSEASPKLALAHRGAQTESFEAVVPNPSVGCMWEFSLIFWKLTYIVFIYGCRGFYAFCDHSTATSTDRPQATDGHHGLASCLESEQLTKTCGDTWKWNPGNYRISFPACLGGDCRLPVSWVDVRRISQRAPSQHPNPQRCLRQEPSEVCSSSVKVPSIK